jgi:Fe-Mn family superoxide dismutase
LYDQYKYELKPLPYAYDALEPYIDEETMRIHHDKHVQTYVDNLNKALENYPKYQNWPLERLISNISLLPRDIQTAVRNNGGGVYNHNLFFSIMGPGQNPIPSGLIGRAISRSFGNYDNFRQKLTEAALGQFGSGWAWLVVDRNNNLQIVQTPNQDAPLGKGFCPILLVDVWEHAYYLKYQNRRAEYLENWFNIINWYEVEKNYLDCIEANNRNRRRR